MGSGCETEGRLRSGPDLMMESMAGTEKKIHKSNIIDVLRTRKLRNLELETIDRTSIIYTNVILYCVS